MTQLHRRFTDDQVRVLLNGYCQGLLKRAEVQEMLGVEKTRFFALVKEYRNAPEAFSVRYERSSPGRLPDAVEAEIKRELLREKAIVDDKRLPISGYNYSALRDRLLKKDIKVSANTIIDRAKRLDCYKARRKRKAHDREVLMASIGALIQHGSSVHLWSPFAEQKWTLVTSIDDFSRKILFADFVPKDTTWAHIQAVQALTQSYGIPLRYYVDSLRLPFRSGKRQRLTQTRSSDRRCGDPVGQDDARLGCGRDIRPLSPGQRQGQETLPMAPRSHRPDLRPRKHLNYGRCSLRPPGRGRSLQPPSSPLHDQGDPRHPLPKGPNHWQHPIPLVLSAQALHVAKGRFLLARNPCRHQLPTHLLIQPLHRGS